MSSPKQKNVAMMIPARFASTRLPGKPLQKIGEDSLISLVLKKAQETKNLLLGTKLFEKIEIFVASEHAKVCDHVVSLGFQALLTSADHVSGTDRICEAVSLCGMNLQSDDLVLNLQGDEPFVRANDLKDLVVHCVTHGENMLGTLVFKNSSVEDFLNSGIVKCILGNNQRAIYFTRAPSPWPRDLFGASGKYPSSEDTFDVTKMREFHFWHHAGVYCFLKKNLETFALKLGPGALELKEGLEQLRALEAGWSIVTSETFHKPFGIDTPEDVIKATEKLKEFKN